MLAFYLSAIECESDKSKFEQLYMTYRKQMFVVAINIVKSHDDAEDVVHDVFCKVAKHSTRLFNSINNECDFRNYLLRATKNTALTYLRDAKDEISFDDEEYCLNPEISDDEFFERLCNAKDMVSVFAAMDSLDEKYRVILYYYFVLEFSIAEIAELLGKPSQTVRKQFSRGKHKLVKMIETQSKGG